MAVTGGTITSVTINNGMSGLQTWSNLNVSGAAAFDALATNDQAGFTNLFFGGDDTIICSGSPTGTVGGGAGNDTFTVGGWGSGGVSFGVDGGSGSDTLNMNGGITSPVANPQYENAANLNIANIETLKLQGGYNYTIIVATKLVANGSTLTIDVSALGAFDSFTLPPTSTAAAHSPATSC